MIFYCSAGVGSGQDNVGVWIRDSTQGNSLLISSLVIEDSVPLHIQHGPMEPVVDQPIEVSRDISVHPTDSVVDQSIEAPRDVSTHSVAAPNLSQLSLNDSSLSKSNIIIDEPNTSKR